MQRSPQGEDRAFHPQSAIGNRQSAIQNPKSKIQNPKSKIQNPKSKIQNPKSKIQNPKFRFNATVHYVQKRRSGFSAFAAEIFLEY